MNIRQYVIMTKLELDAMGKKNERLDRLSDLVEANKAVSIQDLITIFEECERTIRRDLKQLDAMTSYTHRGKFITLPYIPSFDVNGIWFYKGIGFTKHRNSLDLIVSIINAKESITKEEIEEISKIKISKQIQILLEQDRLHRVKLGAKYCYLSQELAKDKKRRMQLLDIGIEEYYDKKVKLTDLIALLKVVLIEHNIDMKGIKKLIKKYSLDVPVKKVEQIFLKYDLSSKKNP